MHPVCRKAGISEMGQVLCWSLKWPRPHPSPLLPMQHQFVVVDFTLAINRIYANLKGSFHQVWKGSASALDAQTRGRRIDRVTCCVDRVFLCVVALARTTTNSEEFMPGSRAEQGHCTPVFYRVVIPNKITALNALKLTIKFADYGRAATKSVWMKKPTA